MSPAQPQADVIQRWNPPPSRFGPHAKLLAAWVRIQAVTCEQPPQRATTSSARRGVVKRITELHCEAEAVISLLYHHTPASQETKKENAKETCASARITRIVPVQPFPGVNIRRRTWTPAMCAVTSQTWLKEGSQSLGLGTWDPGTFLARPTTQPCVYSFQCTVSTVQSFSSQAGKK